MAQFFIYVSLDQLGIEGKIISELFLKSKNDLPNLEYFIFSTIKSFAFYIFHYLTILLKYIKRDF